ncbi:hypothetical protein [Pseudanabaena sp. UWO310]|uniref:hypothetical protein n=1 Tax=Pseudanabaena sp. UWO310 TaxID=2480795 RepID=UPI001158DAFF|nr:hypothetical protein [Pseudanabaena sp. UWO310]TYQ31490.1 hypothetical protein PseudUWO310_03070 [Pseudanabaena sp. UWO310]
MTNQTSANTNQTTASITPIDTATITKHGESPTSILLAIAILISMLLSSLTGLVRVILMSKPPK